MADVGASHLNHKLATIDLFQQNESAMVHMGLAFLCNKEINGHLETTLLSWPYKWEDGEKLRHQTLRLDQLTYMLHNAPVLQVNCLPLWPHHMGEAKDPLWEEVFGLSAGQEAHCFFWSKELTDPKIQQLLSLLPSAQLLSKLQKTLAVSGRVQSLISHSQNTQALSWYSFSIAGSLQ